jgi:hypothetical protein
VPDPVIIHTRKFGKYYGVPEASRELPLLTRLKWDVRELSRAFLKA